MDDIKAAWNWRGRQKHRGLGQYNNDTAWKLSLYDAQFTRIFVRACEPPQHTSENLACFLVSGEIKVHQDGAAPW